MTTAAQLNLPVRSCANGVAKPFQHRGHTLEDFLFAQGLTQHHAAFECSQNMNGKGIRFGGALRVWIKSGHLRHAND